MASGMNARGMRRSPRVACRAKVQLSWVGESGTAVSALGQCKDISQEGMQLVIPAAIAVRTPVQFKISGSPLQGGGIVRSCVRDGGKFLTGVTFAVQLKVDPSTTPIPGIEVVQVFGGREGSAHTLRK